MKFSSLKTVTYYSFAFDAQSLCFSWCGLRRSHLAGLF